MTKDDFDSILAAFDEVFPECPERQRDEFRKKLENRVSPSGGNEGICGKAAEQVGLGFWEYDVLRDEITCSEMWHRLRGLKHLGAMSRQAVSEQSVHPEDVEKVRAAFDTVRHGDAPFLTVLFRARHHSRDWKRIRSTGAVFSRSPDGVPVKIIGFDQDASGEYLRERLLLEKSDLFEMTLAFSRAGMFTFIPQTEEIECSEEIRQIFGREPVGKFNIRDFVQRGIYPDDQVVFWDRLLGLLTETSRACFPCRMVDAGGKVRHTRFGFLATRDEEGKVMKVFGFVLDNTREIEREAELLESRHRYRMLFEHSNDAVFLLKNESVIEANQRACELFSVTTPERLSGLHPWDLAPEFQTDGAASRNRALEMMNSSTQSVPIRQGEWKARRFTGEEFDTMLSFSRLSITDDSFRLMILRDISDQKTAAKLLENYRAYLSVLAEMRKTFYFREESEILRTFLQNLVGFFGLCKGWYGEMTSSAIVPAYHAGPAKHWVDLETVPLESPIKTPGDEPEFPLVAALKKNAPIVLESLGRTPAFAPWREFAVQSGVCSLWTMPLEVNGETVGGFVLYADEEKVFDVSMNDYLQNAVRELVRVLSEKRFWDRHRIDLREAKDKAESANLIKSQFLAMVSHEIRVPMTAILGYAEMLDTSDMSVNEYRESLRIIRNNGEYLLEILNDILDFSKMEAGKFNVNITSMPLSTLLTEIASLYTNIAAEKGLEFVMTNATSLPGTIRSDPVRLKQILLNLISNAVKFTSRGGVYVTLSWKKEGNDSCSGKLRIDVRDTGIGMTDETIASLFSAFQQAETASSRPREGTGLGLVISRRLAEMLGGDISVSSIPGEGSTFTLVLQQRLDENVSWFQTLNGTDRDDSEVKSVGSSLPLLGRRILLAEDSKDSQRLFQLILNKAGAETVLVENGREAFERCREEFDKGRLFDLVIMDMQMPVMDGCTATRELRNSGLRMPILALTAHSMHEETNRFLEAGCDAFAVKPISREALIEAVGKILPAFHPPSGG